MNASGPLLELAERAGIAAGYHDIWGTYHTLSSATATALLDAMGVACGDDTEIAAALAARDGQAWENLAAPVAVLRAGEPAEILLTAGAAETSLRWCWRGETGASASGEVALAELECVDEREFAGTVRRRYRWPVPDAIAAAQPGYHRLELRDGTARAEVRLINAPARAYCPPGLDGHGRIFGVALQLYGLRSARNWGIGDFGDLATALELLHALGADAVGLNPLHALYPDDPERASPYSPSSRLHMNAIYIDVEALEDFTRCPPARALVASADFARRLDDLRATELVDYAGVATAKREVLELVFRHFREGDLAAGGERARAFRAFQRRGGDALHAHARFEASTEAGRNAHDGVAPAPERIEFYEYLQWQCDRQLERIAHRAEALGMEIGLYVDLAVGNDGGGADVRARPGVYARGASVGAPPDDFALSGQAWGLAPPAPERLAEAEFEPFAEVLRANMRHAGAVRVDHVIGLHRMFWVPDGRPATEGAYVGYPLADLLGVLALESHRNRCLVVGEDLGTVPDEVRAALHDWGILSYRVLYFERRWHTDGGFCRPEEYPRDALVTVSTHDLPTLAGFWVGRDLDWRRKLGLFPDDDAWRAQRQGRGRECAMLLDALAAEGLKPDGATADSAATDTPAPPGDDLVRAIHRYAARTPAQILMVQLDDALGIVEQANLPSTTTEHPNWRRKLPLPVEDWAEHPALTAFIDELRRERPPQD